MKRLRSSKKRPRRSKLENFIAEKVIHMLHLTNAEDISNKGARKKEMEFYVFLMRRGIEKTNCPSW